MGGQDVVVVEVRQKVDSLVCLGRSSPTHKNIREFGMDSSSHTTGVCSMLLAWFTPYASIGVFVGFTVYFSPLARVCYFRRRRFMVFLFHSSVFCVTAGG